jgi:hypothetical protein
MQSAIYYNTRIFKERVKTSWGRDSMLLKDLFESRHHHRIYMNEQNNLKKKGFEAFSGLHEGLVLLKDLSKPSMPNRTYMSENHFKTGFQCLFGLTRRIGAIERLIQTSDAK